MINRLINSVKPIGDIPIYISSSGVSGYTNSNNTTINNPTGIALGDLLIAHISTTNFASTNPYTSNGWTHLYNVKGFDTDAYWWLYKIADGNEGISTIFTNTAGCYGYGQIHSYRGVNTVNPIDNVYKIGGVKLPSIYGNSNVLSKKNQLFATIGSSGSVFSQLYNEISNTTTDYIMNNESVSTYKKFYAYSQLMPEVGINDGRFRVDYNMSVYFCTLTLNLNPK